MAVGIPTKKKSTSEGGNGPVFVNTGIIKDVKLEKGKFSEISMTVTFSVKGNNGQLFENTMYLNGSWDRDSAGNITGWGDMSKDQSIYPLLEACSVPEEVISLCDEKGISSCIPDLIGKEFIYIAYKNDDNKSRTSKFVQSVGNSDQLVKCFYNYHDFMRGALEKKPTNLRWLPKDFKGREGDKANFNMNNSHQPEVNSHPNGAQAQLADAVPF